MGVTTSLAPQSRLHLTCKINLAVPSRHRLVCIINLWNRDLVIVIHLSIIDQVLISPNLVTIVDILVMVIHDYTIHDQDMVIHLSIIDQVPITLSLVLDLLVHRMIHFDLDPRHTTIPKRMRLTCFMIVPHQ